jgi:DNA adenine methylase
MQQVRNEPERIHGEFISLPVSQEAYYRIRAEYNSGDVAPGARAARFLYLNRYCFNGLWRTNLKGEFNVPFGGVAAEPPPLSFLLQCSEALQSASINCVDFKLALNAHAGTEAFFFVDPPYFTHNARTFREYGPKTFTWADFLALQEILLRHRASGGHVALVYCDTPEVRTLFDDWHVQTVAVTRNVGGFSSRRKVQSEVLITSFPTDAEAA